MKQKKVKVSSLTEVLPKDVVEYVSSTLTKEYGKCYDNAFYAGNALRDLGYNVKVCYGLFDWIGRVKQPHSFNRIDINGKTYYIDFQFEIINGTGTKDLYLVQEMDVDDVDDIFYAEGQSFCPFLGYADYDNEQYVYYDGITRHSISFDEFDWSYKHLDKYGYDHVAGDFISAAVCMHSSK